jgi:hypothetical protein
MNLTSNEQQYLKDYESKSDVELALLSVYTGSGKDSLNRAALAESAAIFAKACFGHPSPSKRQKLRGSQCLRRPQPSCFIRWIPSKGYPTSFSQ